MSAAITCTSCNRPLRVPESVLGQTVQCPLCLDEFTAQADPAAEAAARAAEPPARRAAPKPERVAAHLADDEEPPVAEAEEEPVWVEPVAEVAPPKKAGRTEAEGRSFAFPVLVTRDPDRVLRGRMDAELTDRGLHLRKQRQQPAFAAVGGKARYVGANRLVVTVEGREVELVIDKSWTSNYHLARDVAGFLNGQRGFPDRRAYNIPWFLYCLPALFVVLPFAAGPFGLFTDGCLGVFLWCLIAAVLAGVSAVVVAQPRLTPRARLIGAGGLVGLGAALYLIAIPLTPAYTVDPSLWRSYTPPDGDFTVVMPGTPVYSPGTAAGTEKYTKALESPDISFTIYVAPTPLPANNPFAFQPVNNVYYQAVNDAKTRLQQEYTYPSTLAIQSERDTAQNGQPCHEMVFRATLGFNDVGMAPTKTLVARVYVVGDKTYTLTALGPRVKADGTDVLKFFNSFQTTAAANVKPAPPPAPPANPRPGRPESPVGWNGLLAYWSFDNAPLDHRLLRRDRALPDESGNILSGMIRQATVINDGARGQAVHFSGPGSYFDFSDANNLNFRAGDDFTFCGWVRTRGAQGVIVSNRQNLSGAPEIDLIIENGALAAVVRQDGNDRIPAVIIRSAAVNDGSWHHFALTRRSVGGNFGALVLYLDGVRGGDEINVFAGGAVTTDLRALGAELYLQRHGFPAANTNFVGDVDEFAIFNRKLDDGEIRRLAGVGGP